MALSKQVVPDIDHDEPVTGQDYLMCGIEDCEKNCQFYCNPCHRPLCKECRDGHNQNPKTKNHEVVPYIKRKRKLPVEKCKDHPTKDLDMHCEDCLVLVCSKCATENHRKHELNDLETIYSENFSFCLDKIHKVYRYFIPTSQDMRINIKENFKELKSTMDKIRRSMKAEAESLKCLVDSVTSENIEQVSKIERSLQDMLQSQDKTYQGYISYLEDLVKKFHGYLSYTKLQNNPLFRNLSDHLKIQPIPQTTKPVPPVFTAGQYSKKDVTKLLGKVTLLDTKPEIREIKPMETTSTQLKSTEQQRKQDREKSDAKPTLSLSSSVTKVREYKVPGVEDISHISLGKSGRLWASDHHGNIVQTDLQGNQLQKIQSIGGRGYHTVTTEWDLIYTDQNNKVINKIIKNNKDTVIKTAGWAPISIHSSHINGDIFVGMKKYKEAKVTRYNNTREEIQNIQRDNKGQELYSDPHYITENINGDICTSDWKKRAVVVVNKSGQHMFSYTGQGSKFYPFGICTDLLGHILVCNSPTFGLFRTSGVNTVHLLDQDGGFLSLLLTPQQGINYPRGLCVDNENNLLVGQYNTNTVTVYKYLQDYLERRIYNEVHFFYI